ncbi:hypothetical protein C8Q78DRAFT_802939 [Trametes maxima]|nr:hypothetical protein C8Q78DRAFT_802939 [Trametes maxima]
MKSDLMSQRRGSAFILCGLLQGSSIHALCQGGVHVCKQAVIAIHKTPQEYGRSHRSAFARAIVHQRSKRSPLIGCRDIAVGDLDENVPCDSIQAVLTVSGSPSTIKRVENVWVQAPIALYQKLHYRMTGV